MASEKRQSLLALLTTNPASTFEHFQILHSYQKSSLQSTAMTFLLCKKVELLTLLLLSAGGAVAVSMNTTALNTNTTAATASPNSTAPIIDGRCNWSYDHGSWGFQCINLVYVDVQTSEQKEAEKQENADGKDGQCLFTYNTGNYTCTQRRFDCQDQTSCIDHRTPEEKAEDAKIQAANEVEKRRENREKAKWLTLAGAVVGGIVCAGIILGIILRCCRGRSGTKGTIVDAETLARAVESEVQKVRQSLARDAVQRLPTYTSV